MVATNSQGSSSAKLVVTIVGDVVAPKASFTRSVEKIAPNQPVVFTSTSTGPPITLDWKFEGPSAGFLVALDKGYYAAEGLEVTIDSGNGSTEGINRVASGTYDLGFADINTLIRFRDKNPSTLLKAVMMLYDAPPFAVVFSMGLLWKRANATAAS